MTTTEIHNEACISTTTGAPVQLSPQMVTLAIEGKQVAARLSADKKRMETLKDTFEAWFILNGTREATNAAGTVVAVRTHADPRKLDQKLLKATYPKEFEACNTVQPWDSVSFK